jgi:hypothetical protein
MRHPRTTFRAILALQVIVGLLAGWQSLAGRTALPTPLREYTLAQPELAGVQLWFGLLFALLAVVTTVAAFLFWPPARPLWVGSFALAFFAAPFFPPTIQTSLASTLQSAAGALAGLLVGLMYFAPSVAAQFQPPPRGAPGRADMSPRDDRGAAA